jgi:hypothetical protein
MKCHQWQFAEIVGSEFPSSVRNKAYPITAYDLRCSDDEIIGVTIMIDGKELYVNRKDVLLYKAGSEELIVMPDRLSTETLWNKFLKKYRLTRRV